MKRGFQALFFALLALAFAQAIWHGAHLPDRVATHFNVAGHADGWMARDAHIAWQCALMLIIGLIITFLAGNVHRLPERFLNLPHKEYWLAPAHRPQTFGWLAGMLYAVGAAVLIFFMFLFQRIYQTNLSGAGDLGIRFLPMVICQFIFVLALVILLLFRFRQPLPVAPVSKRSQRLRR